MSIEDEELFIGEVLAMKEHGFDASRAETLPSLFKRMYGGEIRRCPACERDSFDKMIKWAQRKTSTKNQHNMTYKIKHEYRNKDFPIRVKGARIFVNSNNLTDERAQLLLAIPKYAHVLEPTGQGVEVTTPVTVKQKIAKAEPDKIIPPKLITPELEKEPPFPNEPAAKESKASTSTSKEVKKDEKPQKGKPGPKAKSK